MMYLKKISLHELPKLIGIAYKGDYDLFSKFHIAELSYEQAVNSTFEMIRNASAMKKLTNYSVIYNKQPIGYVTTFDGNFLYSYAIAVKYRINEIINEWWILVKSVLDKDFTTMIYGNNIRAVRFLSKHMTLIEEDHEMNVLIFKNL